MKYQAGKRRRASEYEKALVDWWKKNRTFEKSVEQRPAHDSYVFYDGPPFITGMPHHGTLLSSIVKDAVPRFWTMRGKRVERRWGWDCHGLPAENFVEKQLGITDRREIGTKWSLEDYILKARESMVANSETWEGTIERIGRWVDFKGAYRTMDKNFMESVWWAFKTLYEAGKIYEGRKVLMYDTKFCTPVSKSEVTMDNDAYQEVTDPSAYVKFALTKESLAASPLFSEPVSSSPVVTGTPHFGRSPLVAESSEKEDDVDDSIATNASDEPGTSNVSQTTDGSAKLELENGQKVYFLAWTTTPWTLPANMALAVNPEMEYIAVKLKGSSSPRISSSESASAPSPDAKSGSVRSSTLPRTSSEMTSSLDPESGEVLILAKSRLEAVLKDVDYEVVKEEIKGSDLLGLTYEPICEIGPLFDGKGVQPPKASLSARSEVNSGFAKKKDTWTVLAGDFVSDADGTGIVHIAPAYGEDDYKLAQEHAVDFVDVLDEYGYYTEPVLGWLHEIGVRDTDERGIEIWAGNKFIAKCLEEKGTVWKIEYIKHEYPFNPRSKQRIMYRAFPSWFFDVRGQKELMIQQNENINWFPEYLKHGRFEKNIEQAPDWNLSRDRFWATAMPVWKSEQGTVKVFGSYAELKEYSGQELEDYHRPWVDQIEFSAMVKDSARVGSKVALPSSEKLNDDDSDATHSESDPRQPKESSSTTAPQAKSLTETEVLPYHDGDAVLEGYHLEHFKRIEKVLDCWFESGSMPFAQMHYPFENKEKFEQNYPADFIVEYVGQVRAWFYYVHCVNTALASIGAFGDTSVSLETVDVTSGHQKPVSSRKSSADVTALTFAKQVSDGPGAPNVSQETKASPDASDWRDVGVTSSGKHLNAFKNVITTGTLAGNDGRKMSKSLGNYTDPNVLMDQYSADALRFLLLSSPVLSGEDFALTDKDVSDVQRKLAMIWNVYDFFVTYAEVDEWSAERIGGMEFDGTIDSLKNPLDKWIMSRLNQLNAEIMVGMEEYNIPKALSGVLVFVDDLSNWFVRRSRRRFWKSEDDGDKNEAYVTLYTVLVKLSLLLAPFVPFLAEELYQNMTGKGESVHLLNYPTDVATDEKVLDEMACVREVIAEGLALRMQKSDTEEQIKVRQPLAKYVYVGEKLPEWAEDIIREEVNVKAVENGTEAWLDKEISEELQREGFVRELIRTVQSARKKAGLQVDDRIKLNVSAEVPEEWRELLQNEVLATELTHDQNYDYDEIVKVNGENVTISLEKA